MSPVGLQGPLLLSWKTWMGTVGISGWEGRLIVRRPAWKKFEQPMKMGQCFEMVHKYRLLPLIVGIAHVLRVGSMSDNDDSHLCGTVLSSLCQP